MEKIKNQIKKLALNFELEYNPDWFNFIWISKRDARYLEYVGMCFDPIYTRFGKTINERIKNIEKFESSKEFKKIRKEFSGQAITKKEVLKGIRDCKKIKDLKLRKELLELHQKIKSELKEGNLVLLTQTNNKKQKHILLNFILVHEWIHILLIKNNILFKSISENYWKYDEGLVTYLKFFLKNKLSYLKSTKNKIKYPNFRIYYAYAIKFQHWLKNCKTPKERKQKIKEIYRKLKCQMN